MRGLIAAIMAGAVIVGVGVGVVAAGLNRSVVLDSTPVAVSTLAPVRPMATTVIARSGAADADLGTRPFDFGTQGQARELLALMDQQPGKTSYRVTYRTTADVVVFGCDLDAEVIARVHQEPTGHGSKEAWRGSVMERLRSGANGDSLNDTPSGKSLGSFERF